MTVSLILNMAGQWVILADMGRLDDDLSLMATHPDDQLGLDHVNRTRLFPGKGDSIFIR